MTNLYLFSWEQGWFEARSQDITVLWIYCTILGFAERSGRQPCRAAQAAERFTATRFKAMGYSDCSNIGLNGQSMFFPVMIILCFLAYHAGKFLLSKVVVLELLFLGK